MLKKSVLALAVLASAARAETLTCPIGGERFAAPEATICGAAAGHSMLLMPLGCPPAPVPQCPQNFLPMYRDFSAAELELLAPFMQSESYESNVDFSPYYLAYIIEKYLNGPDKQRPAQLLLHGLWQVPTLIWDDPAYMAALAYELEARLAPDTADNNAFALGLLAFIRLLNGDTEAAKVFLARAENQPAKSNETLAYLAALRACMADQSQPFCTATAAIPQP